MAFQTILCSSSFVKSPQMSHHCHLCWFTGWTWTSLDPLYFLFVSFVLVQRQYFSVWPQQLQICPSLEHGQPPSEHIQSSKWKAYTPVCPLTGGPEVFFTASHNSSFTFWNPGGGSSSALSAILGLVSKWLRSTTGVPTECETGA